MNNYTGNGWEGKNYDSSLGIVDIAKLIRKYLKDTFKGYKFSVTTNSFSGGCELNVSLTASPIKVFVDLLDREKLGGGAYIDFEYQDQVLQSYLEKGYAQINQYSLKDNHHLTAKIKVVLGKITSMVNSFNRDDSDSMIDYFDKNFYYHLSVGKWDKPCITV